MSSQKHHEQGVEQLLGEERGMPSVNETGTVTAKRGLNVIVLLLILVAAFGIGYWKHKKNAAKAHEATAQKNLQLTNAVPARTFVAPPTLLEERLPSSGAAAVGASVAATGTSVGISIAPALPGNSGVPVVTNGKPMPILDKSGASLMAIAGKTNSNKAGNENIPAVPSSSASNDMAKMLSATSAPTRKAGILDNRNFILAKGSFIDCALQTRLDSTVAGMAACVITRNIYSDNGKVLLVERGSTVSGEYKANMRQGMARIFVLWSRIKTPNGVIINLDSPGTDPLGGAGVPGYIDNHFWQRFGGALMFSLVDDVARSLTSNTGSSGNTQFNFNSASDATQNMAAEVLKNTINIPPTLYKNQGAQVSIYIARDLDFSSVYDVTAQ